MRNAGSSGKFTPAGLPDIGGYMNGLFVAASVESGGALTLSTGTPDRQTADGPVNSWGYVDFKASKSSQVYGSNATVMPASADMFVAIYLGSPA